MKLKLYAVLFLICPAISALAQSTLKINEVMASNSTTLASDLGNFGDWIEIYNPSSNIVDIGGMYITDDMTLPTKYQFPISNAATVIPANGFKLVWADDSNQVLHTSFKLSGTTGETVALFAADGITLIDSVTFGPQTADVSYGRATDGAPTWTSFTTSTPEASNNPTTIQNKLSANNNIVIFPNPAEDVVCLSFEDWGIIHLIDSYGKIILTQSSNNLKQVCINTSNLNPGLYFLKIVNAKNIYTKQFIKS